MDKEDFYKKYANSVINIGSLDTAKNSIFDRVNSLIFELDNYAKYPKINTCGLFDNHRDKFEINIRDYDNERKEYSWNEIVHDINNMK